MDDTGFDLGKSSMFSGAARLQGHSSSNTGIFGDESAGCPDLVPPSLRAETDGRWRANKKMPPGASRAAFFIVAPIAAPIGNQP